MLGDEPGVERVDRVRIVVQRLGEDDLCAGLLEKRAEALVLPQQAAAGPARLASRIPPRARTPRRSVRRTSTRRSGSTIERQPYVGITTDYSGSSAEVAELADAPDSKSGGLRVVWVQVPPSA